MGPAGVPYGPRAVPLSAVRGAPGAEVVYSSEGKVNSSGIKVVCSGSQLLQGLAVSLTKFVLYQVAVMSIILTSVIYLKSRKFSFFLQLICNL